MLTREEFFRSLFGLSGKGTDEEMIQANADYDRYAARQADPDDYAKRVAEQDACVRAHAEELAGEYGQPESAEKIEKWLNAKYQDGEPEQELIVEIDLTDKKKLKDWLDSGGD